MKENGNNLLCKQKQVIKMQKICIRNNGPVKYFEMEIEKFNLLI